MVQMTVATAPYMAPATGASVTITGVSGSTSVPISVGLAVAATTETVTIATSSATFPAVAGATASVPITVTGTNGFIVGSGSTATTQVPLSYTCTGFPSESTCNFSPSSGSNVSAVALTMSIATTAPTAQMRAPLAHRTLFYALLLPGMFGIVFAGASRSRGARLLGLLVVLSVSTLGLGSCGGNSSNSSQKNPGTPAGTYPIVVKATTSGTTPLTSTFTVNLTVSN